MWSWFCPAGILNFTLVCPRRMHQWRVCLQPVNKPAAGRIAPVSGALAAARRDPRLARLAPAAPIPTPTPTPPIAPNVFDIKPLDHVTKRKNVITIDVRPDATPRPPRDPRRRDPRRARPKPEPPAPTPQPVPPRDVLPESEAKKISRLPPIPKIRREPPAEPAEEPAAPKRRKDAARRRRDNPKESPVSSPEKKPTDKKKDKTDPPQKEKDKEPRRRRRPEPEPAAPEVVAFKELRNYHKERYMRRNKEKSESPPPAPAPPPQQPEPDASSKISLYANRMRG